MTKFDKKIKKLSKEFQVPETYHKKVDEILETIQEDCVVPPRKKSFVKVVVAVAALCLLITGYLCFSSAEVVEASFLGTFKQTIMDFLEWVKKSWKRQEWRVKRKRQSVSRI